MTIGIRTIIIIIKDMIILKTPLNPVIIYDYIPALTL